MDAEVSIDERLLEDVLTEEWRSSFYPLHTPADVAEHLAFNLIQGRSLSSLDGFADQDSLRVHLDFDELVTDVAEVGEREISEAARRVACDVVDAIHAASDGRLSHEQAIHALDEIIRHAAELRRAYVDSRRAKARRARSDRGTAKETPRP
jgi:hypothetical protein